MHLTLDLYLLALRGQLPVVALVRQAHAHLSEVCDVCATEWEGGEERVGAPSPFARLRETRSGKRDRPPAWYVTLPEIEQHRERLSRRREAARLAREDLNRLLRLPKDRWRKRVIGARTRFRSRAFAQLLLSEYQHRVSTKPRQAAALAELVPLALSWTEDRPELAWPRALCARAGALHANALRISGDLPAAAAAFATLRGDLVHATFDLDPTVHGEMDSLEASLCIDQRRFAEAERLLASSISAYRSAQDSEGEGRGHIQLANLFQHIRPPADVLLQFERAAALLDPKTQPYLLLCTVSGRVNSLCDLDRHAEADRLLRANAAVYEQGRDVFIGHHYEVLQGRTALGLGQVSEAERHFEAARDGLLDLGRDYDAILTSLYLADALLAAGKLAELRALAAELVPLFRARGVARETLAALRLLAQAAAAETLTAAVLQDVRKRLEGAPAAKGE